MSSRRSRSGGTRSWENAQAVEEVLAEPPLGDLAFEVAVGGGDDAHVHLALDGGADRADLPLLQRAQQLRLDGQRHLADLVEEQGAAVGQLEEPFLVLVRAGERAALVPEQLALEQRPRDRRAVDRPQRPAGARGERVDGRGDEFLARSRLAADEHRGLGARDTLDDLEHPLHGGIGAPQPLKELRAERARELCVEEEYPAFDLRARADGERRDAQHVVAVAAPWDDGGDGAPGGESLGDGPLLRLAAQDLGREDAPRNRTEQGFRRRRRVRHPQRAVEDEQRAASERLDRRREDRLEGERAGSYARHQSACERRSTRFSNVETPATGEAVKRRNMQPNVATDVSSRFIAVA